jgi:hypothetical protein
MAVHDTSGIMLMANKAQNRSQAYSQHVSRQSHVCCRRMEMETYFLRWCPQSAGHWHKEVWGKHRILSKAAK